MDHGEHIHVFVWSLRRTVSSFRITILRLPDNYNRRTCLQTSVGGARIHCMHARVGELIIMSIIFSYKFKILNNKEKPSTTGKLNQWWKQRRLSTCMILNCTSLKKRKDTNKKLKRFLSKSKGCRVVKCTTGSQCKLTRNNHGMSGNTIDLLTDHRSLHLWLYIRSIFCHKLNARQVSVSN